MIASNAKKLCYLGSLLATVCGIASAQDNSRIKEALTLIIDFSHAMCGSPQLYGHRNSLELTGTGKVEVSKLIKQLADLKLEGAAKYQDIDYQGPLQADLARMLKDSSDCRLRVFEHLSAKLIPEQK